MLLRGQLGQATLDLNGQGGIEFGAPGSIGAFDNTIINESGRFREGDDYHRWLMKTPYAGQRRATSIGNNDVFARRSVVPETHHVTTWTANECIDFFDRRDRRFELRPVRLGWHGRTVAPSFGSGNTPVARAGGPQRPTFRPQTPGGDDE